MIDSYIKALQAKDYQALSACFSEFCRTFDYCPQSVGRENAYVFGRRGVEMFYHNQFILGGYSIIDPRVLDDGSVDFYANYRGVIIHAIATVESANEETGLIEELVIRPA